MLIKKHQFIEGSEDIPSFFIKLAEKTEDVFWVRSSDYKNQIYISPAYEQIWGRTCQSLYENPDVWLAHIHPEDVIRLEKQIKEERENPKIPNENTKYYEYYRILRPTGEIRHIKDCSFPLFDSTKTLIGFAGIARDITQDVLHLEELKKAKEEAELANKLKLEFIGNMQHDIRTPFFGLWSIINSLVKKEEDEDKKKLLLVVEDCTKELLDFCNYILDFSKIDSGEFPVLSQKFDLKKLIQSVITIETPPTLEKKLDFITEYDKALPPVVIGDQHRLQRILINLLSNAIKFTSKGSVSLIVKLAQQRKKKVILQFIVRDTGIGIPKDKYGVIYEKFMRLTSSSKGIYKGQGLGLHMVKQFVDDMDGEIEIESEEGQGTTFTCNLPFKLPLL